MEITKTLYVTNPKDWRKWLKEHYKTEKEIWLVYYKKGTGKPRIQYNEAVEEALCFGWIDSIIQKVDEEKYVRKFNPRRMGSQWSETNKRRVARVIREGRMTEAGMAKITFDPDQVDVGKPESKRPPVEMPERVEQALRSRPGLWEAFQNVPPSLKRNYILWLSDAKKPETFEKRLKRLGEEVMSGKPTSMH